MKKLPAESVHLKVGKFLKANPAPMDYLGCISYDYIDEVLKFTEQFFDIFLGIYRNTGRFSLRKEEKKWTPSVWSITGTYLEMTFPGKC